MLDLNLLYKDPAVNRLTAFADETRRLDSADIAAAYAAARASAPRRLDRGLRYLVDHAGPSMRSDDSNRVEEHLALALWGKAQSGQGSMRMPDGRTLEILDYQTPLKAARDDKGIGKVDLLGVVDRRLAVIELKVEKTRTSAADTPLRAYLEALAYCAIVEANTAEIATEVSTRFGMTVDHRPPSLIVMASRPYWSGFLEHPGAGDWWRPLSACAAEIDARLDIDSSFLAIEDTALEMGTKHREPRFIGDWTTTQVAELIGR